MKNCSPFSTTMTHEGIGWSVLCRAPFTFSNVSQVTIRAADLSPGSKLKTFGLAVLCATAQPHHTILQLSSLNTFLKNTKYFFFSCIHQAQQAVFEYFFKNNAEGLNDVRNVLVQYFQKLIGQVIFCISIVRNFLFDLLVKLYSSTLGS